MRSVAIVLEEPGQVAIRHPVMNGPEAGDVVVEIDHAGISTGTEKLLWLGQMPVFPGMGYPLVPGYESVGRVVDACAQSAFGVGDQVFVPGAHSFSDVRSLFGANARRLVVPAARLVRNDVLGDERGILLALAATAHHALAADGASAPDLIVGHGVLGRLLARIALAKGMAQPTVWEIDPARTGGSGGTYRVTDGEADERRDYRSIYDCTGNAALIPDLIGRLAKGGELVLAGFYPGMIQFPFAPAFMREARLRIAAEWTPADMAAVRRLIADDRLSLNDLITHRRDAHDVADAYPQAFSDRACLKMVLNWSDT